ncbi:MAG: LytTR family transcriptional regulator DNA-binding domain-containing protein [Acidobacteriota bacterium]
MRVVVVEDEVLAREALRDLLAEHGIAPLAEATDGRSALAAIARWAPDVVFLDIRLPELSGLEVLEGVEPAQRPLVVFTTAYDRYAVTAFELEAVDYLVKPFGRKRFAATLARVREKLRQGKPTDLSATLREDLFERPRKRLFARKGRAIVPVPVDQIELISGADDYSRLCCGDESYLVALRLRDLEAQLDPDRFLRIHRSHLINLDRVAEIRPRDSHRLEVILRSGARVPASRQGSARLRGRMLT